jgi:hypothetical protein
MPSRVTFAKRFRSRTLHATVTAGMALLHVRRTRHADTVQWYAGWLQRWLPDASIR